MPNFAKESNKDIVQAECLLCERVKRVQVSFIKCVLLIRKNNLTIELFHKRNYFSAVAS